MWTAVALLSLCVAPAFSDEHGYHPKIGERHPDFLLPSIQDGKPVSLSSLRGRKVLLVQFASW